LLIFKDENLKKSAKDAICIIIFILFINIMIQMASFADFFKFSSLILKFASLINKTNIMAFLF
jgi:hypothetical protein